MTSKADITFIAARGQQASEALNRAGTTAWETSEAWKRGASTANYDPEVGGNRWEQDSEGQVWAVPSDPTGDAALTPEQVHAHEELVAALDTYLKSADRIVELVAMATPRKLNQISDRDRLAAQVAAEGWCASCYRNGGKLQPQAMHPDGRVKYQGSCRWCKEFEQEYGRKPPLSLLEKRHAGRSVTLDDIAKALGYAKSA